MKTGIDVLEEHGFDVLKAAGPGVDAKSITSNNADGVANNADAKKRIGLVTNQTGVDGQGMRTIDVLAKAPGVSLDAIFSPGARGDRDAGHDRCR